MNALSGIGVLLISFLFTTTVFAQEDKHHDHEQHAAHVHGLAKLLVAVEANSMELLFETPAMNLLGFEHKPKTADQQEKARQVLADLNTPEKLFNISSSAGCVVSENDIQAPYGKTDQHEGHGNHHSHDHEKHHDSGGEHSDYLVRYRYTCENPNQIKQLNVNVFELFPMTESIEVQAVSPLGQKAYELTSGNNRIPL